MASTERDPKQASNTHFPLFATEPKRAKPSSCSSLPRLSHEGPLSPSDLCHISIPPVGCLVTIALRLLCSWVPYRRPPCAAVSLTEETVRDEQSCKWEGPSGRCARLDSSSQTTVSFGLPENHMLSARTARKRQSMNSKQKPAFLQPVNQRRFAIVEMSRRNGMTDIVAMLQRQSGSAVLSLFRCRAFLFFWSLLASALAETAAVTNSDEPFRGAWVNFRLFFCSRISLRLGVSLKKPMKSP